MRGDKTRSVLNRPIRRPIEGGKTKESRETLGELLEPGVYEFFCRYHGGMDGVLEIVPALDV